MTDRPAARQRGSLPGLALVVGLLAFLIADAGIADDPGGSPPSGDSLGGIAAVIAFFAAAGAVVLLFVLLTVTGSALRRRSERRSAASPAKASWGRPRRLVSAISFPGNSDGAPGLAAYRKKVADRPVQNDIFVRAVDELLAETAWRPPDEQQAIEADLVALTAADDDGRARILLAMVTRAGRTQSRYEVESFRAAMYRATDEQRAYLAAVVRARQGAAMIDDLAKLLDRVSAPADLAVILLLGPLAYGLDAGLDVIGFLAPSYVAIGSACIGLGVKKVVDLRLAARTEQRALDAGREHLMSRAKAFEDRMAADHAPAALVERLSNERALHSAGITTDGQLETALGECLAEYRSWLRTTFDSGVEHRRG